MNDLPPIIIKTYEGSRDEATAVYQIDAAQMASQGYFATSQIWTGGRWSQTVLLIALVLCLVLIGFLILLYMFITSPSGRLTVTYELRQYSADEKTCPQCAEQVKAAAQVCHFCGYHFATQDRPSSGPMAPAILSETMVDPTTAANKSVIKNMLLALIALFVIIFVVTIWRALTGR